MALWGEDMREASAQAGKGQTQKAAHLNGRLDSHLA